MKTYRKPNIVMLNTKCKSFGSCCLRKDFLCISHREPIAGNGVPGAYLVWTPPVARLAGFIKRSTIYCIFPIVSL